MGPTAFRHHYKRAVLVGYGIYSSVAERPKQWCRRTLPTGDSQELTAVQSLVDRVWPICKDPGAQRGPRVILGAAAEADVVVPDYSVSTRHCAFSFEPGRLLIADLESLNGTFMAGRRLESGPAYPLADRVPLCVGRIKLQYLTRESFHELVARHAEGRR